jgi:hypothetical protein
MSGSVPTWAPGNLNVEFDSQAHNPVYRTVAENNNPHLALYTQTMHGPLTSRKTSPSLRELLFPIFCLIRTFDGPPNCRIVHWPWPWPIILSSSRWPIRRWLLLFVSRQFSLYGPLIVSNSSIVSYPCLIAHVRSWRRIRDELQRAKRGDRGDADVFTTSDYTIQIVRSLSQFPLENILSSTTGIW